MRHKSGLVSGGGNSSGSSSGPSPTKNKPGSSSGGSSSTCGPPALFPGIANSAPNVAAEAKMKDMLKELYHLIHQVQDERTRGEHNLTNIGKTHERILQEQKISPYYKSKLKGLYNTAMQDAESEAELLRKALDKINEVKSFRNERRDGPPKQVRRRGVLMSMLQQNALTLPLWIGKPGEKPPPLCGAMPAESTYIAKPRDKVAARVKGQDGEENWILSEVVSFNSSTNKFEVDDIDAEEGKERHVLSRRRIVPLPVWKANPETDPEALFPAETLVLALYPQTTCFYRALIHDPPKRPHDDYSLLFEDNSYPDGYSPPLNVAQRYVILCKDDKKK